MTERQLRNALIESKDEVFIGSGFFEADYSDYNNKKIQKHLMMISRTATARKRCTTCKSIGFVRA